MNSLREQLLDRMIRIYGYEHPIVLNFCKLCSSFDENEWNDKCLITLVESHEANPIKAE